MTRQLTLIVLAFSLLAPTALLAQPQDPGNGQGGGGGLLRELLPPPGYLRLTDEQKDAVRALAEDLRDALAPLRDERQSLGTALRDALAADAPDATEVGQLTLDIRAVGQQIRDELVAFEVDFRDLLDADQQVKWDNFLELRRLSRRGDGGPKGLKLRRLVSGS